MKDVIERAVRVVRNLQVNVHNNNSLYDKLNDICLCLLNLAEEQKE